MLESRFLKSLAERVMVFDGAMGTSIHALGLDLARDYLGKENCPEVLNLTRPDAISRVHGEFIAAGCDAVETNTFGANPIVLKEFGLEDQVEKINAQAVAAARQATKASGAWVVGSVGPGTRLPTLGQVPFGDLRASYERQMRALMAAGVDAILIETSQDLLQAKAAIQAAGLAWGASPLPLIVQVTLETNGTMLVGSDISAVVAALEPLSEVSVLGLNCGTGPREMGSALSYLATHWPRHASVMPNAGLPQMRDGHAFYPLPPDEFAAMVASHAEERGLAIVGGCCGTLPGHIAALVKALDRKGLRSRPATRPPVPVVPQASSLYSAVELRQDASFLIVAERTNSNGSKKFRELLQKEDWDGVVAMARDEIKDGAHVMDVCVDQVGRDGLADMRQVAPRLSRQVDAPIMVDSTDPAVMEAALEHIAGRAILNSMNLEDGPERMGRVADLARRFGAAVVAGTIDEQKTDAMARTADRKLAIAKRILDLAVSRHGLRPQDVMFDPLVLPISTGLEADRRNALETIEGIRRIAAEMPDCHTVIGLSNVSFGLKAPARAVLNSVFLAECLSAGLTAAILHFTKILPRDRVPADQWEAALDLIYDRRQNGDPLTRFIAMFKDAGAAEAGPAQKASVRIEDRLRAHIVEGIRQGLEKSLEEAMQTYAPLAIINDHLLDAMKTVGELFGSGRMQLPFVLQSAEVMKAAVGFLEPHMEHASASHARGTIVLATVKGDVHDIGKNLVDIILSNNGFKVYNLGIKQPLASILDALKEHHAQAIGMSGLLVKSVLVMKENLEEMQRLGINVPVLLGGAALNRDYVDGDLARLYSGPVFYCRDAFEGLRCLTGVAEGKGEEMAQQRRTEAQRRRTLRERAPKPSSGPVEYHVGHTHPVPVPPFWGHRTRQAVAPGEFWPLLNRKALFLGQWGLKSGGMDEAAFAGFLKREAEPVLARLMAQSLGENLLQPKVTWGYFPVQSEGDELIVFDPAAFEDGRRSGRVAPGGTPTESRRMKFPRQASGRRLCLADFFRSKASGEYDVLGMQLVTVGPEASRVAQKLYAASEFKEYLFWHGFAVESAEALAEWHHGEMRRELAVSGDDGATPDDLFRQGYRGSRYSYGYPACPNLEDRAHVFALLRPGEIGVTLTENWMLEPEQSTDALVVHHPQAKYFDV